MICPFCSHPDNRVVDSREVRGGAEIRRRRECSDCGRRFTTYERVDDLPATVVKRDGSRESFDREKLLIGLLKACEKRPVARRDSSVASLTRWASPPERVVAGWPKRM